MKKLFFLLCLTGLTLTASAEEFKLDVPEMEPKLTYGENTSTLPVLNLNALSADAMEATGDWKPDFDFFKSKTAPGVKPYKFMDDMTFVGVPLFFAGPVAAFFNSADFSTAVSDDFREAVERFKSMDIGEFIQDVGPKDYEGLLDEGDAYYGEPSALALGFYYRKKPIMIINTDV